VPHADSSNNVSSAMGAGAEHLFATAFADAFGPAVTVSSCELDSFRRTDAGDPLPGVVRVGCCRISIDVRPDGISRRQIYALCEFDSIESLNEAGRGPNLTLPEFGPAVVRLPALRAALFAFPNDPGLPHLSRCLGPEAIRDGLETEVDEVVAEPLKYDPARGCTLRVRARIRGGGVLDVIAKTHHGRRLERTFETMSKLGPAAGAAFPRALAYDAGRKLLWQERAAGRAFWAAYPDLDVERTFRAMAAAAAVMHGISFAPPERRADAPDPAREQRALAAMAPDLARRHAELWERLGAPPIVEPASLHGDFHPNQFLIDGDRVALTDFDKACWGDPGQDIGCFVSHVLLKAIEANRDPAEFASPIEGFLEAHALAAPNTPRSAEWHTAAHLLARRARKLIERDAGRPALERLFDVTEEWVRRARGE